MRGEGLLQKLLFQLCDPTVTVRKVKLVTCIITRLLREHFATGDISRYYGHEVYYVNEELPEMSCIQMLIEMQSNVFIVYCFSCLIRLGVFLVYTLPPPSSSESCDWSTDSGIAEEAIGIVHLTCPQQLG